MNRQDLCFVGEDSGYWWTSSFLDFWSVTIFPPSTVSPTILPLDVTKDFKRSHSVVKKTLQNLTITLVTKSLTRKTSKKFTSYNRPPLVCLKVGDDEVSLGDIYIEKMNNPKETSRINSLSRFLLFINLR